MKESLDELTFDVRDDFQRESVADQLISLITSDIEISPLVIDGDWGTGKTEFCAKLKNKLVATSDYRAVYVDAFKADHADNPLMTILSALLSLVDNSEKHNLREKALPVLRFGAKVFGKAIVSHLLRTDAESIQSDFSRELDSASDEVIDATVRSFLKDHEEAEANIKALQDAIALIADDTPIVIFIDELDRCRPDYAVQMLELIKHTFDVSNVKFILITNMRQLKAAIKHTYGIGNDAERYLDKFIKFRCVLPETYRRKGDSYLSERNATTDYLISKLSCSSVLKNTNLISPKEKATLYSAELARLRNLSLREVETFVRHLEIYNRLTDGLRSENGKGYVLIRIFGVFVYCFDNQMTQNVVSNKLDEEALMTLLKLKKIADWNDKSSLKNDIEFIAYFLARDFDNSNPKWEPTEQYKGRVSDMEYFYFGGFRPDKNELSRTLRETLLSFSLGINH